MAHKNRIITTILLLLQMVGFAQVAELKFRHMNIDKGLSNNYVTSIIKDSGGFIWIGTFDGLNRYDGYEFKTFKSYGNSTPLLSSNIVNSLFEDSKGNIWIGTLGGGLNKLDASRSKITIFEHDAALNSISSNHIFDVIEDSHGIIWIATGGGLNKYNPVDGQFSIYTHHNGLHSNNVVSLTLKNDQLWVGTFGEGIFIVDTNTNSILHFDQLPDRIVNDHIWDLHFDKEKQLWIATEDNGLIKFNLDNNSFEQFGQKHGEFDFLNNNFPVNIAEDNKERLWIATDRGGLYAYNKKSNTFVNHRNNPLHSESLLTNALTKLLVDDQNLLWVGTYDQGFSVSNFNQEDFLHFEKRINDPYSLSDNSINCILEDSSNNIWIGTENGLNKADSQFKVNGKFDLSNGMSDNVTLCALETSFNEIWFGTYTGGISIYNKPSGQFRNIKKPTDNNENGISSNFIRSLYEDSQGLIWIGTIRGGVDVYNHTTKKIRNYPNTFQSGPYLNSSNILSIIEDNDSNMLFATYGGGVNKYNRTTGKFTYYTHDKNQPLSLSSNQATCQLIDSNGDYWVGTNFGLNHQKKNSTAFNQLYIEDGLSNNSIVGLLEDANQNIWICTQNGLSIYNMPTKTFTNYFKEDGLQANVFHYNTITTLKNGAIACGGLGGLNVFNQGTTLQKQAAEKVYLTGLSIFNNEINFGKSTDGRIIYKGLINETKEINLSHNDKLFELSYSTLSYKNPKQTSYLYKIDELHSDWINLGNQHSISFHNLRPGKYTFRIKSTLASNQVASGETILKINIHPPYYETVWFYAIIVVIIIGIAIAFYNIKNKNIKQQRKVLEHRVAEKTKALWLANEKLEKHKHNLEQIVDERTKDLQAAKEKAEKADALKTAFLANMSHEIRTPMNAILGFVDLLNEAEISPEDSGYFKELIAANGVTLMRLIDDIMDLARIESGDLYIKKRTFNLVDEIKKIAAPYKEESNSLHKGVSFICQHPSDEIEVHTDRVRLHQVLTNLLNNAAKFTESGTITLEYHLEKNFLHCSVKDSGIGIPAKEINNIFNRFNKLDASADRVYRGTGLGLAISKELVKLLGGIIWVESAVGKGSTFYFTIRIDNN